MRGIRGNFPLLDGGYITRPEFARYGMDSKWVVENRGVQPDIEVENRPDLVVKGQDPQLERAIEEVMKQMQSLPKTLAPATSGPTSLPGEAGVLAGSQFQALALTAAVIRTAVRLWGQRG